MPLPFTLVVVPPTRAELRALAASPRAWLCALLTPAGCIAGDLGWLRYQASQETATSGPAPLAIASEPAGATAWIDGHARGQTPLTVDLTPGPHTLTVRQPGFVDLEARIDLPPAGATFDAPLWPQQASASRLRPTLPGATLADATFLADGRIALVLALPADGERQAWLLDPASSGWQRVDPASRPVGAIAVAPTGDRIAYLAAGRSAVTAPGALAGGSSRLDELWIGRAADQGQRRYALPAGTADQQLSQVSWSPDGVHLLLTARQRVAGGAERTRLLWLDVDAGDPRELVVLPSAIVPGSFAWSPAGDRVAFVARPTAGNLALCLVDSQGDFRDLADLGPVDSGAATGFPPVAFSLRRAVAGQISTSQGTPSSGACIGRTRAALEAASGTSTSRMPQ